MYFPPTPFWMNPFQQIGIIWYLSDLWYFHRAAAPGYDSMRLLTAHPPAEGQSSVSEDAPPPPTRNSKSQNYIQASKIESSSIVAKPVLVNSRCCISSRLLRWTTLSVYLLFMKKTKKNKEKCVDLFILSFLSLS